MRVKRALISTTGVPPAETSAKSPPQYCRMSGRDSALAITTRNALTASNDVRDACTAALWTGLNSAIAVVVNPVGSPSVCVSIVLKAIKFTVGAIAEGLATASTRIRCGKSRLTTPSDKVHSSKGSIIPTRSIGLRLSAATSSELINWLFNFSRPLCNAATSVSPSAAKNLAMFSGTVS